MTERVMKYDDKDIVLTPFRHKVRELARLRNGEIFHNSGSQQANIVVDEMVNYAARSIDILSGHLSSKAFSVELFEKAFTKPDISPANIRVILCEPELVDENGSRGTVDFLIERNVEVRSFVNPVDVHLMLVDGDSFRVEHNTAEHRALFSFGNNELAADYQIAFDRFWHNSEELN